MASIVNTVKAKDKTKQNKRSTNKKVLLFFFFNSGLIKHNTLQKKKNKEKTMLGDHSILASSRTQGHFDTHTHTYMHKRLLTEEEKKS
jgi:hypothetical protein